MKNSARPDKIPAPISLSKRSSVGQLDPTTPYRLEWGAPLQSVVNGSLGGKVNKSSISNMKEELSSIKTDVEKLLSEECPETRKSQPSELVSKSVRAELEYHKQVEEKLRAEIRELKLRLSEEKMIRDEKEAFERRMDQLRNQWKAEKLKLKKENEQAAHKYAQDAAKWQTDYDALLQRFNTLSLEYEALQQAAGQQKRQLLKTVASLEQDLNQKQEEYEVSLRERQSKYESALSEFKKLQVRFDKNTQENVLTLIHKNIALEQEIGNLTNVLDDQKRRYSQLSVRYQRLSQQNQQLKARTLELENKIRQPNRQGQLQNAIQSLKSDYQSLEARKAELYTTYLQKCRQLEELQETYSSNISIPGAQLQRLRVENVELTRMDQILRGQINLARERIKYLETVMSEKDSYIEALEDSQPGESTNQTIRDLQEQCKQLLSEKMNLVRDYEKAIRTLQNSMAQSRQKSMTQSMILGTSKTSNFDEALKEQIHENEQLRTLARERSHQIYELQDRVAEMKRMLENVKNQRQLQKLRIQAEEKTLRSNHQLALQDMKYELDSCKRRFEAIERKLEMKVDQIRKKDEFIRNSIVGRIGKQQSESDIQYMAKQLQKFIQLSVADVRY